VAAVGHLFGPNPERGLYKTMDGGKTWTNTKFIDADTGFTDVVMDPSNPDVLFAASYQRRRQPWGFNGGGPGSAIWKTTDGAKTWTRLAGNGLPTHSIIGRIGLAIARSRPQTIYATIEVGPSGGAGAGVNDDGTLVQPGQGRGGGGRGGQAPPDPGRSGVWRSDDGGKTWRFLSNQGDRWMYYSKIAVDPTNPEVAYQGGAPFFQTVDGGRTWRTIGGIPHSDHHAFWINPRDPNHILLGNDGGLTVTYDRGATWEYINTMPLGQFYAVSADMRKPYYVCGGLQDNGTFCGPSATRSANGIVNADWYRVGGGDGFYTSNDPNDYRIVFAQSQDGNVTRVDLATGRTENVRPRAAPQPRGARGGTAQAPAAPAQPGPQGLDPASMAQMQAVFERIGRDLGFVPPTEPNIVPAPPAGQQFRFYWNTPTVLSPHNPAIVYVGGERLFISRDRGRTWTMTGDLTRNVDRFQLPIMGAAGDAPMASKHDGAGSYSNIVTVAESPLVPGLLWVGTNDGNVQVSRDGGATWTNVAANVTGVPDGTHVSRVEPSRFDAGTCYVTFDGHRTDDHNPYVFATRDFGRSWTPIAGGLPKGNVNVIREDPKNRNLLYLGTEYAFFVSLDGGRSWRRFMNGLPTVRIDDILVHPRDNDLIVGTHGRSIWIVDDITPLQGLTEAAAKADAHLFQPRAAVQWASDVRMARGLGGAKHFQGENPEDGVAISYLLKTPVEGDVKITIVDVAGRTVREMAGTKAAGLNRVRWNLRGHPPELPPNFGDTVEAMGFAGAKEMLAQMQRGETPPATAMGGMGGMFRRALEGRPVEPGTYLVKLTAGGKTLTSTVVVEADSLPH
jgi:photosystem II stability/assembly factor-like uncharacterized protein